MKAQAAFEYMLVVLIALAFMVPLWTYMITVNSEASDELSLSYAKDAARMLSSACDLVYTQGPPAKVSLTIFVPSGTVASAITNGTIMFTIRHGGGESVIFAESRARINGTLPASSGSYVMEVSALDDESYDVEIREKA
ncbi:MAG: hypothetical protein V1813_01105 [Candidatus Aenigmatarchaeota archaeon]